MLRLVSFTCHPHGLSMPNSGTLQHLLCGLSCVRAHLAASSITRKRFLQVGEKTTGIEVQTTGFVVWERKGWQGPCGWGIL